MPVYSNSEQLYGALQLLFRRIQQHDPGTVDKILASRLVIHIGCTTPEAEVTINGRSRTLEVSYGKSNIRPDLDVELSADALHAILLKDLPLRKALGSGLMKVKGPVWKIFALETILHAGQGLYPQVVQDRGMQPGSSIKA